MIVTDSFLATHPLTTQIQDILKYYGLPTLSDPMRNFYTACGFDEKMNIHNMEYKGVLGDRCFYYLE